MQQSLLKGLERGAVNYVSDSTKKTLQRVFQVQNQKTNPDLPSPGPSPGVGLVNSVNLAGLFEGIDLRQVARLALYATIFYYGLKLLGGFVEGKTRELRGDNFAGSQSKCKWVCE